MKILLKIMQIGAFCSLLSGFTIDAAMIKLNFITPSMGSSQEFFVGDGQILNAAMIGTLVTNTIGNPRGIPQDRLMVVIIREYQTGDGDVDYVWEEFVFDSDFEMQVRPGEVIFISVEDANHPSGMNDWLYESDSSSDDDFDSDDDMA